MSEWKTIDTAPRDAREVLIGAWDSRDKYFIFTTLAKREPYGDDFEESHPKGGKVTTATHWASMPYDPT